MDIDMDTNCMVCYTGIDQCFVSAHSFNELSNHNAVNNDTNVTVYTRNFVLGSMMMTF